MKKRVPAGLSSTVGVDGGKFTKILPAKVLLPRVMLARTPYSATPPFLFRRDSQFYTRPTTLREVAHSLPSSSTMSYKTAVEEYEEDIKIVDASASVFTMC